MLSSLNINRLQQKKNLFLFVLEHTFETCRLQSSRTQNDTNAKQSDTKWRYHCYYIQQTFTVNLHPFWPKNNIVLDGKFYFHVMTFSFYQESMKLEVTLYTVPVFNGSDSTNAHWMLNIDQCWFKTLWKMQVQQQEMYSILYSLRTVFRIRDFWYGSRSLDPYTGFTDPDPDPDPALFVSDF